MKQLALLGCLVGCAEEPPRFPPDCSLPPAVVGPEQEGPGWVIDSVRLPTSALEAQTYGLDIDCDPQGYPDNAIGQILSALDGHWSINLNQTMEGLIGDGRLLHLVSTTVRSLPGERFFTATLLHGVDTDGDPTDNLLGGETFGVDADRGSGDLSGLVIDGRMSVLGGQVPIGMTMPGLDDAFILPTAFTRIDATVTSERLEGRIAGAISEDMVDEILLPFGHLGLVRAVDRDCTGTTSGSPPCGCAADSFGESMLGLFDELPDRPDPEPDGDCVIELEEMRDNSLMKSLLGPDLDLFDADGRFDPRQDGVEDSLSFGLWFSAVPAVIQR